MGLGATLTDSTIIQKEGKNRKINVAIQLLMSIFILSFLKAHSHQLGSIFVSNLNPTPIWDSKIWCEWDHAVQLYQ